MIWLVLAWIGCTCAAPPEVPPVRDAHYDEWDGLVRATVRGDVFTAKIIARDLTEGEAGQFAGAGGADGAHKVGGALGFLQIATSSDDLVDGLTSAAAGCGTCHDGARVAASGTRPEWGHQTGAAWAVWGLVFSNSEAPPAEGDATTGRAGAAWREAEPPDTGRLTDAIRTGALIAVCQDCHIK